ncbi:division/cell wall cluster transcriptional repressor MraZ [Microgenomates group bacterium]|nr:division/cell wall cluster transcriptional repressor MraZ [Microgenomates group bacterium]
MFIGSFYHKLEAKGRLSLPKPFRAVSAQWVITAGLDGSLFLFPQAIFTEQMERLKLLSFNKQAHRDYSRLLSNQASVVVPDQLGRILIPDFLVQRANLTRDVVIVGSSDRLEIFDQATYNALLDRLNQDAASIAENIDLGIAVSSSPEKHPLI